MANQLWTELNDQQAQSVSGGNFGQGVKSGLDLLGVPPSRANTETEGVSKNWGDTVSNLATNKP